MDKELEQLELGPIDELLVNTKAYKGTFKELNDVDGFTEYLKETMAMCVKRYFHATPDNQAQIKGYYTFVNDLYKKIQSASQESIDNK